jgi:hypothetical protein
MLSLIALTNILTFFAPVQFLHVIYLKSQLAKLPVKIIASLATQLEEYLFAYVFAQTNIILFKSMLYGFVYDCICQQKFLSNFTKFVFRNQYVGFYFVTIQVSFVVLSLAPCYFTGLVEATNNLTPDMVDTIWEQVPDPKPAKLTDEIFNDALDEAKYNLAVKTTNTSVVVVGIFIIIQVTLFLFAEGY